MSFACVRVCVCVFVRVDGFIDENGARESRNGLVRSITDIFTLVRALF